MVADTGSVTRASEKLNVAQTALGQQLRRLEESLQVQLLVRHSRGTSLTEPGKVLYRHAVAILEAVEEARVATQATGGQKRILVRLGLTPSIQAMIGAEILQMARLEIPNITLRLFEELSFNLLDALERGEIDCAFLSFADFQHGGRGIAVIEEELVFVTGPDSRLPSGPVRFSDIVASGLALTSERDVIWRVIHDAAQRLDLDVRVAFKIQSMPAISALVARGVATSVVPYGLVADDVRLGRIRAHAIVEPTLRRTIFLVNPDRGQPHLRDPQLAAFLNRRIFRLAERLGRYAAVIGRDAAPACGNLHGGPR